MNEDDLIYKIFDCKNADTSNFFEQIQNTLEWAILRFCFYEKTVVYLSFLVDKMRISRLKDLDYNTAYMKIYRAVKKLEDAGLIFTKKQDGFIVLGITQKGATFYINLIKRGQNSNSNSQQQKRIIGGVERLKALEIARDKKMLEEEDKEKIFEQFEEYLFRIDNKLIILKEIEGEKLVFMEYQTRFNSTERVVKNLDKFDKIVEYEAQNSKFAVFLTLTTDPKRFKNCIEANKHFAKAFNRFMTYCRKYAGARRYIASYEFTKKGLLHAHIIIFGTKYLLNYKKISALWDKHGQGKIVWIYALKNNNGQFTWLREKPKDCKEKSGTDYLKKYLKKAIWNEEWDLMLYWLFNKRFFTYSRFYGEILKAEQPTQKPRRFEYLTILDLREIPEYIKKSLKSLEEWIREEYKHKFRKAEEDPPSWLGDKIYYENKGIAIKNNWSWL